MGKGGARKKGTNGHALVRRARPRAVVDLIFFREIPVTLVRFSETLAQVYPYLMLS